MKIRQLQLLAVLVCLSSLTITSCAKTSNGPYSRQTPIRDYTVKSQPPMPITNPVTTKAIYHWGKSDIAMMLPIIDKIAVSGINIIYLDLEPYMYDQYTDQVAFAELNSIVSYAATKKIQIHSLLGAPNWAEPTENKIILKGVEFIKRYNSTIGMVHPISGLHLNIEFYNIKDYTANKDQYTINYLRFMKSLTDEIKRYQILKPGFAFSSTLCHFSDLANDYIPFVTFNSTKASVFTHSVNIFNQLPNSALVIMSYRTIVEGPNSVSDLLAAEFKILQNYNTKIVVGIETTNTTEKNISLFGQPKTNIDKFASSISEYYKATANYSGVAIHDTKGYMAAQ
jgi:hypothetical protein